MQTNLAEFIKNTPEGREAETILRKCVHCGFCTATCPTYQLLGDELDGPRGRIYLMKQVLEGVAPTAKTQLHLDRCLTCRSCESTCPSGVQYGRLVDIGRGLVAERVARPIGQRMKRAVIAATFPSTAVFKLLFNLGRPFRFLLPSSLRDKMPASVPAAGAWPASRHARRMLVLAGCVQPALSPDINASAARVLDRLGISLVEAPGAGCCGAVRFHLDRQDDGRDDMRRLIDAWWPHVEAGVEAIVMTASGCGATVKEYGHLLAHDPAYAGKAKRIASMTRDLTEVITAELDRVKSLVAGKPARRLAFHSPCTLQHGLKLKGVAEKILAAAGFELAPVPDAHLCCGAAGTYSIFQPELSKQLRANKLAALHSGVPSLIASANMGCQVHLAGGTDLPVKHWIVALEEQLVDASPAS